MGHTVEWSDEQRASWADDTGRRRSVSEADDPEGQESVGERLAREDGDDAERNVWQLSSGLVAAVVLLLGGGPLPVGCLLYRPDRRRA